MKIKNVIISLLLALFISVTMQGQEQKQKGEKLEKLKTELDLTEEQSAELKLVFQEIRKEKKVIKQNDSLSDEEKKSQLKEVRAKMETKLKSTLTDEQFSKYKELKRQRKDHKVENRGEHKKERGQKLKEELDLTDGQAEKLKQIKKDAKAKRKGIKENSSMEESEKKEKLKEIKENTDQRIKDVLTDEQYKKLKELKAKKKAARKG